MEEPPGFTFAHTLPRSFGGEKADSLQQEHTKALTSILSPDKQAGKA